MLPPYMKDNSVYSNDYVSLEAKILQVERICSLFAAIPIVGTPFGLVTASIGITQTILGVAFTAFAALACRFNGDYRGLGCRSVDHIKNGLGNIFSGLGQAIPIVGTLMYILREAKLNADDDIFSSPYASQQKDKWIKYDVDSYQNYPTLEFDKL